MRSFLIVSLLCLLSSLWMYGQDTLPDFSVSTKGKELVTVRWKQGVKKVTQVTIQRSYDSLKHFKTIYTVPDLKAPAFTYTDAKAPTAFMYYRLFILLDSGRFLFTPSQQPTWDTMRVAVKPPPAVPPSPTAGAAAGKKPLPPSNTGSSALQPPQKSNIAATSTAKDSIATIQPVTAGKPPPPAQPQKTEPAAQAPAKEAAKATPVMEKRIIIKKRDTIVGAIPESRLKAFADSLITKTKDTFILRYRDTLLIKPFVPKEVFKASAFIFTDKDGNIQVQLPDIATKKYSVDFFDEKGRLLYSIGQVRESPILIDKANFLQAGWYLFELKEEGLLKEKNRFYIPREF